MSEAIEHNLPCR